MAGRGAGDGLPPAAVRVRPPLSRTGRSFTATSSRAAPPRRDSLRGTGAEGGLAGAAGGGFVATERPGSSGMPGAPSGMRFAEPAGRPQRSLGGGSRGALPSMQRHASGLRFAEPVLAGARAGAGGDEAWDPAQGAELPPWSRPTSFGARSPAWDTGRGARGPSPLGRSDGEGGGGGGGRYEGGDVFEELERKIAAQRHELRC
ncbi:hypothetical protein T484DRAFT_3634752, partial [Baffinella frigidus]